MSALDDLKASKAVYDQASADAKAKLGAYADQVNAVDPKAPDAEAQVAAIEAERSAYYDTAKADIKAKFNAGIEAASRVRDPDVAEGQAVLNSMTQDLKSVREASDAVKTAEADKLAEVFKAPPSAAEVKAEVADVPAPDGTAPVTTQSEDAINSPIPDVSLPKLPIPSLPSLSLPSLPALPSLPSLPKLPSIGAIGLPSMSMKSSDIAKALGGMGTAKTVLPQNASSSLTKANHTTEDFKLKLTSKQTGEQIVFNVSPSIDESRSANYEHISPVHHPGTIQVYKNSESRQFNIAVKLISRTSAEASQNIKYINLIRSWVMPYYGQGTANSSERQRLGGPPDILLFDVYGDQNISGVPVVLTSYHWVYPDQVDYIPTLNGIPFPTIMDISLSIIESYSPEQFTSFDITAYKVGDMVGAYTFSSTPVLPDADVAENREADLKALIDSIEEGN
jgi:hypothetical protein